MGDMIAKNSEALSKPVIHRHVTLQSAAISSNKTVTKLWSYKSTKIKHKYMTPAYITEWILTQQVSIVKTEVAHSSETSENRKRDHLIILKS
jgi:2-polyprenyl-3-methyl-5-hydroxy-6-metoxy-1,4-benzoquinol methylase